MIIKFSSNAMTPGLPEFAGVEEITKVHLLRAQSWRSDHTLTHYHKHLSGYGKLLEVKLHPSKRS